MKSSQMIVLAVAFISMVSVSQAFFFGDSMLPFLMMQPNMMGSMFGGSGSGSGSQSGGMSRMGGMPLWMMMGGNDAMKDMFLPMMLMNKGAGGAAAGGGAGAGAGPMV